MPWKSLEFWGSVATLIGSFVLVLDVARQKRLLREQRGGEKLRELLKRLGRPDALDGGVAEFQEWLAERMQRHARLGFALLALGFLLNHIAQWTRASG